MLYSTEHGLISSLAKSRTSHHDGTRFDLLGRLKKKRVSLSPEFANLQSRRGSTHSLHISKWPLNADVIGKLTVTLFYAQCFPSLGMSALALLFLPEWKQTQPFFDFPISDVFKYHLSRLRGNHDYGKNRSGM